MQTHKQHLMGEVNCLMNF